MCNRYITAAFFTIEPLRLCGSRPGGSVLKSMSRRTYKSGSAGIAHMDAVIREHVLSGVGWLEGRVNAF